MSTERRYDPKTVEPRWQQIWEDERTWQVSNDDFPVEKPFADPCGAQRLPNGNTVIASYGAKGPIKIFEVTPDKKVAWVLWDWKNLGPATAVQILDDSGIPEIPGESEH